jgi:thiamine pyrophosphokinase
MEINIVAGGPEIYIPDLRDLVGKESETVWIGVDRGSLRIMEAGIHLHGVFGDFDSISKEELKQVQEQSDHFFDFPPEKDATDLELALEWAYKQVPDRITIYGATGGRMDHTLANIMMLSEEKHMQQGVPTRIVDLNNEIRLYEPGSYILEETALKYISFIPITEEIEGMTLVNFKYPLSNVTLHRGRTLSVSNELNSKTGNFSFSNGILLVVRSRD